MRAAASAARCASTPSARVALQDRPHLDDAGCSRGAARSPIECRTQIGDLDEAEAAELLLGIGIGPVLHVTLAVGGPYGRAGMGPLQGRAAAHHAGIGQGLAVGPPARPVRPLPLAVGAGGEVAVTLVDQDRILHVVPRLAASVWRSPA